MEMTSPGIAMHILQQVSSVPHGNKVSWKFFDLLILWTSSNDLSGALFLLHNKEVNNVMHARDRLMLL